MNKRLFKCGLVAALFASTTYLGQAQMLLNYNFNGINESIPDGNLSGWVNVQNVTTSQNSIQSIKVTLTLEGTGAGAFNGDLFGYISHGGQIAVLLNRPGRTASDNEGYADNGFTSVTFEDSAANGDIHLYQAVAPPAGNGALTGTWEPDGRHISPTGVLDTTPRTAMLNSFQGQDPNGTWTLFLADSATGGNARLASWTIEMTAVPEPGEYAAIVGALLMGFGLWRKQRSRKIGS